MDRLTGLLGIAVIFGLAFLMSNNRKAINYRLVVVGTLLQIGLAVFILKVPVGQQFFGWLGQKITNLLELADEGAKFVFGSLTDPEKLSPIFGQDGSVIFFFKVIPAIIFVAVLVNISYHLGLMQRVINVMARGFNWLLGASGAEALSNISSIFVGQVEAQFLIKPYLKGMTKSELLSSMAGSMACIAGGIMAVYISMGINASYLLAASLMAAPGALVISKIVFPETEESETKGRVKLEVKKAHANLLDSMSAGASDGLKVGLNVVAMLIGFIAAIALVDVLLGYAGSSLVWMGLTPDVVGVDLAGLKLDMILGWAFSGLAWCMGVPSQDMVMAGSLMGKKLVVNEFVAFSQLSAIQTTLDPKTVVITSFALCGFANFSSIAIQVGGIGQLVPERRADLAKLGFKALICGTLASYLSASIAGILM